MGLELVELVLAVEESFGIAIPDAEAEKIRTPNQLVDYVSRRLASAQAGHCLSQRAFYRVRRSLVSAGVSTSRDLRTGSPLAPLFPPEGRRRAWASFATDLGIPLPDLRRPAILGGFGALLSLGAAVTAHTHVGWLGALVALPVSLWLFLLVTRWAKVYLPFATVDELVEHLASRHAARLVAPGEPWTEQQIRTVVFTLIRDVTGLREFDPDGDFVHDLRLD